jgi:hypothetical protein
VSGRLIQLSPSAAVKQRRLEALLAGRDPADLRLDQAVEDAQALGSLELAGVAATADEVGAARRGEPAPPRVAGMLRAQRAVPPPAPFSVEHVLAWHTAVTGSSAGFRAVERERPGGPAPAPAVFVASRVAILGEWVNADSARELKPAQLGALVLARLVEILPFEDGNGRVARLAASHVMVQAGGRPPVLVGADAPGLREAIAAAFQLVTAPLTGLLEQAAERGLDVMIRALEADTSPGGR